MTNKDSKKRVIFICRNNSGRSQMAEAIFRHLFKNKYEVHSAGTDPRPINPLTFKILKEIGIDASTQKSKDLQKFQGQKFDVVITLCDDKDEACPLFLTGEKYIHRNFKDPGTFKDEESLKLEFFRKVRDEIYQWIEQELRLD